MFLKTKIRKRALVTYDTKEGKMIETITRLYKNNVMQNQETIKNKKIL